MMTRRVLALIAVFLAGLAMPVSYGSPLGNARTSSLKLAVIKYSKGPVLTVNSPGAEGIKYGFEGGRALKLGSTYYIFTSEMQGDPRNVKMELGYWTSSDRDHWKRGRTLFTSSGNYTGADPRAALWAPMPVYNPQERRWNLFYVAYRSKPDTRTAWYGNYDGTIWRAISEVAGRGGIGGPYRDAGIILQPGKQSQSWEGLQGTDSFFPYPVDREWYAFYGSAHTEVKPISSWEVGLASAPHLAGPWQRCPDMNPLRIEKRFIENPVVTQLRDGMYLAVYDTDVNSPHAIGYTFSTDGIHWEPGQSLILGPRGQADWANRVRTPLGLIPEKNHTFTMFYTALQRLATKNFPHGNTEVGSIGWVLVRLERGS